MASELKTSTTAEPNPVSERHQGSRCPNCGAPNVHRAHRRAFTEHLLALVGARTRRCHKCNVRFAWLFNSAIYIDDARRALRRAAVLVLMIIGAVLVMLIMLWLMNKQAAIGPSDGLLHPPATPLLSSSSPS